MDGETISFTLKPVSKKAERKTKSGDRRILRKQENIQKIINSYQKFSGEFLPTIFEIANDIGLSTSTVKKVCKKNNLPLLNTKLAKKKDVYNSVKMFEQEGGDPEQLTHMNLWRYMTDGLNLSITRNTVEKWRRELEEEGKLTVPEIRSHNKPKYTKYIDEYLRIVNEKLESGEKIKFVDITEEMSEILGEKIPEHRILKLRDVTGIPKVLTNEERYQNIVEVYNADPQIGMERWAEEAGVSYGFVYEAISRFRKNPELRERFNVPNSLVERLSIRKNPLINAFKALGNTNRVKIMKSLSWVANEQEIPSMTVSEIIEEMGYYEAKWRNTIEYHIDILENGGLVVVDGDDISLTSKGLMMMPKIEGWNIEKIIPEHIFGSGYNKPLFALAVSEEEKQLNEIITEMRKIKGYVPLEIESKDSPERKPIDDYPVRSNRFKKYLESEDGIYWLNEEEYPMLADTIQAVRKIWSPKDVVQLSRSAGMNYLKLRNLAIALADYGEINELDTELPELEAHEYMSFIKDNFDELCQRTNINVNYSSIEFGFDRSKMLYKLSLK